MPRSRASEPSQRVLIVRPSALGDVCRTVPALVTLRRAMPDARIDWLVRDDFAEAVRDHPDLDEVVDFPRKALGRLIAGRSGGLARRWVRDLRRRRYDLAVDLQGLARSGLVTFLTGARRRLGDRNARELAWTAYNRRVRVDRSLHTVDRMLALLAGAGHELHHDMRLHVGAESNQWVDDWLAAHVPEGRYACLAPTARWPCKCWPIDRYVAIARKLIESGDAGGRLLVLASPAEQPAVRTAFAALIESGAVLMPATTVGRLMALLRRTTLLVCNDSAPLHIAVAFQRPIAAIFGPTDPALVGPYRRPDTVLRPPEAAERPQRYRWHRDDQSLIRRVTVDEVWKKVQEQLTAFAGGATK